MRAFKRLIRASSLIALFALTAGLQAAPATSAEQWLNNYYKQPAPEQFSAAVLELSDSGFFEREGNVPLSIGFLASVFAQNPDRVNEWMDLTRSLPEAHKRILVAALWYSGNPKGVDYLRSYSRDSSPALRSQILARVQQPDLANAEVLSASSLNLQWGVFLATGEKAPVQHILAALATTDNAQLSQNVRWSLAQNAAQHQRVLAICRDELSRQPNAVRETLRAVINESEVRQPSS